MDNNFNKKNKFIENHDIHINKQPFYDQYRDVNMNDIVKDNYNSKNKTSLELKNTLDPFDYELSYCNKIKKDVKGQEEFVYYSPYDQGPGRGFGNLNINNTIRNSESSRASSEDFKLQRESEIIDRFQFIDNRYTNPKNVVFPFPRSGENTRKNESADDQTLFGDNINKYNFNSDELNIKKFDPNKKSNNSESLAILRSKNSNTLRSLESDPQQNYYNISKKSNNNESLAHLRSQNSNAQNYETKNSNIRDSLAFVRSNNSQDSLENKQSGELDYPQHSIFYNNSMRTLVSEVIMKDTTSEPYLSVQEPNNELISNLEKKNQEQREKQENYIKKLAYVDSVINKLKLQYGTDLTKEIISQYLINNPPEKYIASNNSLF